MHWSQQGVDYWLVGLGRPLEPPIVRERIRTAVRFLDDHAHDRDDGFVLGYLKSIDFGSEVRVTLLAYGERLAAFRRPEAAHEQCFFTKPGTSIHDLGIDPDGRAFDLYSVLSLAEALECRIAPYTSRSGYLAGGGGVQYVVFDSWRLLQRIRTSARIACGISATQWARTA